MIVLVAVLVVVVVALVVAIVRLRSQADGLTVLAGESAAARDQARNEAGVAQRRADAAEAARDAALERAARARRDAAEVARRLQEETGARTEAEAVAAQARQEAGDARDALAAASERDAGGGGGDDDAAFLWAVAVAQVERLWQVSVAAVPGESSPLMDTDDPLAAAAGIVVEAAREEAGAPVELTWEGGPPAQPPTAVMVLAVVQELVAAVAKGAESADIAVVVGDEAVSITVDAVGADGLVDRVAPGLAAGPDRWCVPRR